VMTETTNFRPTHRTFALKKRAGPLNLSMFARSDCWLQTIFFVSLAPCGEWSKGGPTCSR
jgi:hypothetical protein